MEMAGHFFKPGLHERLIRAGGRAGRRAGRQAGGQAGRQAGGRAGRRAGGQAGGQASRRAGIHVLYVSMSDACRRPCTSACVFSIIITNNCQLLLLLKLCRPCGMFACRAYNCM